MTHVNHVNKFAIENPTDVSSSSDFQDVLQLLVEYGFEGRAQAMQTLLNEAMKLERSQVLGAQLYQRTPQRRGYANCQG